MKTVLEGVQLQVEPTNNLREAKIKLVRFKIRPESNI